MDTDTESTQSRQKKGQMKSIFLSDSDEEAILDFIKQTKQRTSRGKRDSGKQ